MSFPGRRAFLRKAAGAAVFAATARAASAQVVPGQGLRVLDEFLGSFIEQNGVAGGALAIAREGRLVYARGFGIADRANARAVATTDLFRISSISKSITAAAVPQLVETGRIRLDTRVWEFLALPAPADPRWREITIQHLLLHTGGWDRDAVRSDPMFETGGIALMLGVAAPPAPRDIVAYMLRQPLQFAPGDRYAYSNFGYSLLGRVIERASGDTYEAYVAKHVLAPLGIRRMRLARTLARAPNEVTYYENVEPSGRAAVGRRGEMVPTPPESWWLEPMDAHGGWLGSAVDVVRFACAFDIPSLCPILRPESVRLMFARPQGPAGEEVDGNYAGFGWYIWPRDERAHRALTSSTGLMPGSSSYLMRRTDRTSWAVLFNTGYGRDGRAAMLGFRDASAGVLSAIRQWPSIDRFAELL